MSNTTAQSGMPKYAYWKNGGGPRIRALGALLTSGGFQDRPLAPPSKMLNCIE